MNKKNNIYFFIHNLFLYCLHINTRLNKYINCLYYGIILCEENILKTNKYEEKNSTHQVA